MGFVGDGNFEGDGGIILQSLWEAWNWKMIRNCPGRYVVKKNKEISSMTLEKVLDSLFPTIDDNKEVIQMEGINLMHVISEKTSDAVDVATFIDGGGVITYCKSNGSYVHTLNTQSGLERKLAGLGLVSCLQQRTNKVL